MVVIAAVAATEAVATTLGRPSSINKDYRRRMGILVIIIIKLIIT
jgi:hypothetical protein